MDRRNRQERWSHSGFFALRTPLLPAETLWAWGEGLEAPAVWEQPERLEAALARDGALVRERLGALVARPEVREALFLGAPELEASLEVWRQSPLSPRGQRIERSLVRYVARMAGRATPMGLFAGVSTGSLGPRTRLRLGAPEGHRRHTRLGRAYLDALTGTLAREPALRQVLLYHPNSSLFRSGGRIFYSEAPAGPEQPWRSASVEETDYLRLTLERAASGARLGELAAALVGEEVSLEEARAYVEELVDAQLLVPALAPPLTGPEPLEALVATLREHGQPALAEPLARAQQALAALDAEGLGQPPSRYRDIAQQLPHTPGLAGLFSVDLYKPAPELTLGEPVIAEILRGVEVLHRLQTPGPDKLWTEFRQAFEARYGSREVPLVEALNEVGFDRMPPAGSAAAPWLEGVPLRAAKPDRLVYWGATQDLLLRKLQAAWESGAMEVSLDLEELRGWDTQALRPLPDAWSAMATLVAPSEEALSRGEFQVHLAITAGPPGVRQLTRFCHLDDSLRQHVERHLRAEEALRPGALFVDIVHAPKGPLRTSDIVHHSRLREHELPFLGRSGAPAERQLPVEDLLLSVRGGRCVLRSRRLGVEVCPRLAHADNFKRDSQAVYRFLCEYQAEGSFPWLFPNLMPFSDARFLPRLVSGRAVLLPATWRLQREELATLGGRTSAERFVAVQRLRRQRRLPRFIVLSEVGSAELALPVDLDHALSVESFAQRVRAREQVVVRELFLGPESLCVSGPEGHFGHEVVVPFVREVPVEGQAREHAARSRAVAFRQSLPGEEWLQARLYGGARWGDELVRTGVLPVVREALRSGAADRWFFSREGRLDWHLRVFLHGAPQRLLRETVPALREAVAREIAAGRLSGLSLHPYERDERALGGAEAARVAEQVFQADSEAVADLLELLPGEEGLELRWWAGLLGVDLLLTDFGVEVRQREALVANLRDRLSRALQADRRAPALSRLYRQRAPVLEALLGEGPGADAPLSAALERLRQRSRQFVSAAAELRALEQQGRLTGTLAELLPSWVQQHLRRLLRAAQPTDELILYEFLARHYRSRRAREAASSVPRSVT
ncbi:MAG: lantibiotic dehydratase [Hyalangium sp.]|uniref:lantibiotic dehydratase n=1 Tax=Hyalangium sp. TaxID=2028555 RepID=UPI003899BE8D